MFRKILAFSLTVVLTPCGIQLGCAKGAQAASWHAVSALDHLLAICYHPGVVLAKFTACIQYRIWISITLEHVKM